MFLDKFVGVLMRLILVIFAVTLLLAGLDLLRALVMNDMPHLISVAASYGDGNSPDRLFTSWEYAYFYFLASCWAFLGGLGVYFLYDDYKKRKRK